MTNHRSDTPVTGAVNDAISYHPETDTYRAAFDGRPESVSTAVVSSIAAVTETDPVELEPLYSVVDPDALDDLMAPPSPETISVSFTLEGHDVTVHSSGSITVQP